MFKWEKMNSLALLPSYISLNCDECVGLATKGPFREGLKPTFQHSVYVALQIDSHFV